jgi:GrpB-like predicted nucleotidyltransferase (UPF0157 family)
MPAPTPLTIGAYEVRPVACRDYDPRAAEVARQVGGLIHDHLPRVFVEHVGSTSVPGCEGKGIVDLLVPVPQGEMDAVKELLERLGFQRQSTPDPFPEDRPTRVGSVVHCGETFLLHVHCVPAESDEVDQTRFFRACLRADPYLVQAYVAKKREIIAGGVTDGAEYCRQKGQFIKEILG